MEFIQPVRVKVLVDFENSGALRKCILAEPTGLGKTSIEAMSCTEDLRADSLR